jgi:hypothetical protein
MSNPMRATNRAPVQRAPRYEVRPSNGTYHIFDTYLYTAADARRIEADAIALCEEFNKHDALQRRT